MDREIAVKAYSAASDFSERVRLREVIDTADQQHRYLMEEAEDFVVRHGLPVVPIYRQGQRKRNGQKATGTELCPEINLRKFVGCNVGLECGGKTGIVALVMNPAETEHEIDGMAEYERFRDENRIGETLMSSVGDTVHAFFQATGDMFAKLRKIGRGEIELDGRVVRWNVICDAKGQGDLMSRGVVLLPPSKIPNPNNPKELSSYEWMGSLMDSGPSILRMPECLVDLLTSHLHTETLDNPRKRKIEASQGPSSKKRLLLIPACIDPIDRMELDRLKNTMTDCISMIRSFGYRVELEDHTDSVKMFPLSPTSTIDALPPSKQEAVKHLRTFIRNVVAGKIDNIEWFLRSPNHVTSDALYQRYIASCDVCNTPLSKNAFGRAVGLTPGIRKLRLGHERVTVYEIVK